MKRLGLSHFWQSIGSVELFDLDLQELLALASTRHMYVQIQVGLMEFDDFDDLAEHLGRVHRVLKLKFARPDVWGDVEIHFGDLGVVVSAGAEYDTEYRRVRDFLLTKRRLVGYLTDSQWKGVGAVLVALGFTIAVGSRGYLPLALAGNALSLYTLFGPKPFLGNRIYLLKRHSHSSFLTRHEEHIWRGVIAVASAAASALLTWYLTR